MNCLTDYIGVLGCGANEPDSGIYVNSLPSINLRQLNGIADAEQENFTGVWNDIQTRSQNKLLVDVSTRLRKRYKLNSFIESFKLSEIINPLSFLPLNEERGFSYDTQNWGYNTLKSQFFLINVEYIKLNLSFVTTNPILIQVIDFDSQKVLFSKSLLVANQIIGWNLIKVNKSFLNQRVKFVYDATEVVSVSTPQDLLISHGCGCFNSHCGGKLEGIKGATVGNDSFGLVAKISLACTYEPLICMNKEIFSSPFLYLLGSEIMIERIYTERLNEFSTVGKEEAKELNNYFQSQYELGMENVISGISVSLNDCCIDCNNALRITEQTP